MKRTAMTPGLTPMKRTPLLRTALQRTPLLQKLKTALPLVIKSKSLKSRQRSVSAVDHHYWDRLAQEIGCIACRVAGRATSCHVSIHHIDGRTKPGCHTLVLPLCAGCHQQGTGNDPTLIAVHPNRKRFETMYGLQTELKARCDAQLARTDARKTE